VKLTLGGEGEKNTGIAMLKREVLASVKTPWCGAFTTDTECSQLSKIDAILYV